MTSSSGGNPTPPSSVLEEAEALIHGDRHDQYGSALDEFAKVGQVWAVVLGLDDPVRPDAVALCMAALKLVREAHKHKRDNLVDMAGYIGLVEECIQ